MLAITPSPLRSSRGAALGLCILPFDSRRRYGLFGRRLGRRRRRAAHDAADGEVAHDAVGDLEHARDLVERRRLGLEEEQVVGALRLVVDLVGEAAPAPGLVALPAAVALDGLADARDDLGLALLRELRVEHQQDLVVGHAPEPSLPSVSGGLTGERRSGTDGARARQEGGQCSIGPVRARTAWLAGAAGAAIAVYADAPARSCRPAPAEDPRADELRQKLDESRAVVERARGVRGGRDAGRRGGRRDAGGRPPPGRPRARQGRRRADAPQARRVNDALLLVDVVNDFEHEGGDQLLERSGPGTRGCVRALSERARRGVRWSTRRTTAASGDGDGAGSSRRPWRPGGELLEPLAPEEDRPLRRQAALLGLRQDAARARSSATCEVERLLLAGSATEGCVAQTAIDARELGFKVSVLAEACATVDERWRRSRSSTSRTSSGPERSS